MQTGQARIRITQNGLSGTSTENFNLMRRPENVRVDRICQDDNQLVLAWDPVDEAFNYDIFVLGSQYMDSIGSTDTLYNITVVISQRNNGLPCEQTALMECAVIVRSPFLLKDSVLEGKTLCALL